MYYLQSCYYDPETCRFINADTPEVICGGSNNTLGNNLFAYCYNNPINIVDHSGFFGTPIQWAMAAVGAIGGWFFGDYVARKLGYSSGWKYWAIRCGVVIGGAVVGWFAGTAILKIAVAFLKANPHVLAKLPGVVKWFLGLGSSGALSSKLVADLITSAKRVGSALKSDLYHRAASWLSSSQLAKGKVFYINGGRRVLLQVEGTLNGIKGIFEYIIDEAGNICHQFFKAGGIINGIPN